MAGWVTPALVGVISSIIVGIVVWSYKATRRLGGAEKEAEVLRGDEDKRRAAAAILAAPIPLGRNLRRRLRELAGRDGDPPVPGVE